MSAAGAAEIQFHDKRTAVNGAPRKWCDEIGRDHSLLDVVRARRSRIAGGKSCRASEPLSRRDYLTEDYDHGDG